MTSLLCVLLATVPLSPEPPPVTQAEFVKLHDALVPDRAETWETIPWSLDLLAAAERARRDKKPLFMWSMNGHPLGCT